jgi:hypothetical protein
MFTCSYLFLKHRFTRFCVLLLPILSTRLKDVHMFFYLHYYKTMSRDFVPSFAQTALHWLKFFVALIMLESYRLLKKTFWVFCKDCQAWAFCRGIDIWRRRKRRRSESFLTMSLRIGNSHCRVYRRQFSLNSVLKNRLNS